MTGEPTSDRVHLDNEQIALLLDEAAELLAKQGANPFRVRAYRVAADTMRTLPEPVMKLLEREGVPGLLRLPGIGESLARSIAGLTCTGHFGLLERLRGESRPVDILATVPGLGYVLAARIHEQLGIDSLPELERAAYDGRLGSVPGMGRDRIRTVRKSLAGRLRQHADAPAPPTPPTSMATAPAVAELLDVDAEYRSRAGAGLLPHIAPRRFNPTHVAWLPILHTVRRGRHYTALFSNTARAHELGTTHDWVVIYRDDYDGHGQWTVITARHGPLRDQRIVRGRERECARYYEAQRTLQQT